MNSGLGRWRLSVDIKLICFPYLLMTLFCLFIMLSGKAGFISSLDYRFDGYYVNSSIYFYSQFIFCFFVVVMSSRMFSETVKPSSLAYIKSLPLSVFQLWIKRKASLFLSVMIISIPMAIVLSEQVNRGIADYGELFSLNVSGIRLAWYIPVIRTIVSTHFYIVSTVALLTICKNEIFTDCLIFAYYFLDMGPLRNLWGRHSIFYGCFSPFAISTTIPDCIISVLFCGLIFEIYIIIWVKRQIR